MRPNFAYNIKELRRQRGLASVEFAIGVLVILLLMLASAEIGRVYYSYNTLSKTVRNGSRYLSTVALNSASVLELSNRHIAKTKNLVIHGNPGGNGKSLLEGFSSNDIRISQHNSTDTISQYVQVSAGFNYRPMLGVVSGFGFGESYDFGFTMNVSSTMRVVK